MQKTIYGGILFKETTLTQSLTARILAWDGSGNLVDRPAIDTTTFLSTALASGRVNVGSAGGVATAVDTGAVGDIVADSITGLNIKAGIIVNADINVGAAIVYSKLALALSIVNGDIANGAAIAYSKLNLATSIVNADVAAAAAIARTKIASGTNYRILANSATGVMSENAAITANSAVVADANGQLVASPTAATQIGYLSATNFDIQSQLDNEIATKTVQAIVKAPTVTENGYSITWDNAAGKYTLTNVSTTGIPTGGTTRQFLGKNTGTNYDASWLTLVLTDISNVTALVADVNLLVGAAAAGVTAARIQYLSTTTSDIQNQLNGKQSSSLANNSMWVGNGASLATALATGTGGYVLTSVGGVPTWQPNAGGINVGTSTITSGTDKSIPFNDTGIYREDASLTWDKTTKLLVVGTATEGIRIQISSLTRLRTTTTNYIYTIQGSNGVSSGGTNATDRTGDIVKIKAGDGVHTSGASGGDIWLVAGSGFVGGSARNGAVIVQRTLGVIYPVNINQRTGLYIVTEDNANSSVSYTTRTVNNTPLVPAIGIGTGIEFEVKTTSTPTYTVGATVEMVATNITGGTEAFDWLVRTMSAGTTPAERIRVNSNGLAYPSAMDTTMTDRILPDMEYSRKLAVAISLSQLGGSLYGTGY